MDRYCTLQGPTKRRVGGDGSAWRCRTLAFDRKLPRTLVHPYGLWMCSTEISWKSLSEFLFDRAKQENTRMVFGWFLEYRLLLASLVLVIIRWGFDDSWTTTLVWSGLNEYSRKTYTCNKNDQFWMRLLSNYSCPCHGYHSVATIILKIIAFTIVMR